MMVSHEDRFILATTHAADMKTVVQIYEILCWPTYLLI